MRSTSLHGEEEHREHRVSLQRHRLPRECVAYIQPCRYDAWLWLPPQDPAAKPPPNRRPLWLPLHCAAARQEASLRFVPRQPNPQKKEQHQENYHASLPASFSPYCSLIKGTKTVQEMLARREIGIVPWPKLLARYDMTLVSTTIESGSVSDSSIASLQRNMAQRLPDLPQSNFRVFSVIAILL